MRIGDRVILKVDPITTTPKELNGLLGIVLTLPVYHSEYKYSQGNLVAVQFDEGHIRHCIVYAHELEALR